MIFFNDAPIQESQLCCVQCFNQAIAISASDLL